MRLIEQQMNEAIHNQIMWSKDNTEVNYYSAVNTSHVRLHGHHIASYNHTTGITEANLMTLAEWPTNTTKSRLRALGVDVWTLKGVTYVDNIEI